MIRRSVRHLTLLLVPVLAFSATACIGEIRDTTTDRTSTEMLLVSTAAQRAVKRYDPRTLVGEDVFIDASYFESVDKSYVVSALRDHLAGHGVGLVEAKEDASIVLEVRNGSLGIYDGDFVLGIPQLPMAAQGLPAIMLPPLYLYRRFSQQGWAKFQFWTYDRETGDYIARSGPLWGDCYYTQWWVFGIGPFDGSNDIYPDESLPEMVSNGLR